MRRVRDRQTGEENREKKLLVVFLVGLRAYVPSTSERRRASGGKESGGREGQVGGG